MSDSVIFGTPVLIALYGAALLLCVADIVKHVFGHALQISAAVVFVAATTYALLLGAGLAEVGAVSLVFLCVNAVSFVRHGGEK